MNGRERKGIFYLIPTIPLEKDENGPTRCWSSWCRLLSQGVGLGLLSSSNSMGVALVERTFLAFGTNPE